MTVHRFFVNSPLAAGTSGALDERQVRQIQTVLRLGREDEIVVFDGTGAEATAVITSAGKRELHFAVERLDYPEREPALHLTVGLALLRRERFELALQKLTELGVRRIVPLTAERCVVSFRTASDWEKRAARYRRIIVEALEQSERVHDVVLASPTPVPAFLDQQATIALVERGEHSSVASVPLETEMSIAVGPEGGWSPAELERIQARASTASLGRLILRAETAAIVAAGTLFQCSYLGSD